MLLRKKGSGQLLEEREKVSYCVETRTEKPLSILKVYCKAMRVFDVLNFTQIFSQISNLL